MPFAINPIVYYIHVINEFIYSEKINSIVLWKLFHSSISITR